MSSHVLERIAVLCSVLILAATGWFWFQQILAARELLEMAVG